jgi:hypothetical protein
VSERLEGEFDRAYALGRANLATIELARRHCLDMAFTLLEGGGRGLAEQFSGLPIDMRQVSCPVARGTMAGMDLDVLAGDFYDRHCSGCQRRRPTGEVPSLASVMDARKASAAAQAEAERQAITRQHREWEQRAERRRAVAADADPAMASAIGDIAVTDHRNNSITSTARELLSAVENAAAAGPAAVCRTVAALVGEERDTGRGIEIARNCAPCWPAGRAWPRFQLRQAARVGALVRTVRPGAK